MKVEGWRRNPEVSFEIRKLLSPNRIRISTFDFRPSTFDLRPWTFDLQTATFDLGPSTFDFRTATFSESLSNGELYAVALFSKRNQHAIDDCSCIQNDRIVSKD